MNYENVNRRHCLEILGLHEGTDVTEPGVSAAMQALRPTATREEASDALAWLRSQGLAERRAKPLAGTLWRITPEGVKTLRAVEDFPI